jgi:hypothetical protein
VAPHPFKVADQAYEIMCKTAKAQCFIIRSVSHSIRPLPIRPLSMLLWTVVVTGRGC